MSFYDSDEGVREYIAMADGYDGSREVARLGEFLPAGSTVLEIGMGPGKDLDLLAATFRATGSDLSDAFLTRYREAHPDADLMKLDAVELATDRTFDCIYSNKVLHHLETDDLRRSLARQHEILNPGGIVLHTLWRGSGVEVYDDMRFVYYSEDDLRELFAAAYEILVLERYAEMEEDDSVLVVARRS